MTNNPLVMQIKKGESEYKYETEKMHVHARYNQDLPNEYVFGGVAVRFTKNIKER